ncbi:MAG: nucleotide pyrophosphohydrolase [Bdellovibrionales bacterium]
MTDNTTDLGRLKAKVKEFCVERDWDQFHGAKDLAIGAVTEASELLEIFRFMDTQHEAAAVKDPEQRRAIGHELADVLFFLLRFAERYNFDLSQEFEQKMELNAKKYPAHEFRGKNHKAGRTPAQNS